MAAVSRRAVLVTGTSAAALVLTPLGWLTAARAATSAIPSRAAFAGCVGATFRVTAANAAADAVLTEVTDLVPVSQPNDPDRFGLIFRLSGALSQGVYTFRQNKIGSCQLFAVPVDRGANGRFLQVVINR